MYVVSEDGQLVNLRAVKHIWVNENYPYYDSCAVLADDYLLYSCKTKEDGEAIIERLANAIKGGVKVYQGKFKA
jgi:hypothetical protein